MRDPRWKDVKPHPSWLFPDGVVRWLGEHGSLIDALVVLRRAGNQSDAVNALLMLQPVLILRISWELWPELGFDEEADPQELLEAKLPAEEIARCRYALWGEPPAHEGTTLRLIP